MKQFLLLCTIVFLLFDFPRAQQSETFHQPAVQKNSSQPDPISDDWYNQAIKNLQLIEHDFYPQQKAGAYHAVNSVGRISFEINPLGYTVKNIIPEESNSSWYADFRIRKIGRENNRRSSLNKSTTEKKQNSIVYKFEGADIEYINDRSGMRQNFIIHKKHAGNGPLKVTMIVTSNLTALLDNNKLSFYTSKDQNQAKLIYSDLKVWDANHRLLTAHMDYNNHNHELSIIVDDKIAVYPVTIDPLNQSPEWNNSVDGLFSGLLTNLQMKTALYGFAVTSLGDVNGDGFGDAAISAPGLVDIFTGSGTLAGVGAVFVYYGSALGLSATPAKTLQPSTAVAGALFGFSVAGGDVTGDNINDIIIGAPLDKYTVTVPALIGTSNLTVTAGKIYVYQGNSSPLTNPSPFLQIKLGNSFFSQGILGLLGNINVNALFGFSLATTEDLNGDGKQDLIVGAPAYVGINPLSVQNGNAFVYYSNNLSTNSPVELKVPTPSLLGLVQLPVLNTSSLLFGYSVDGVGDYNSDGHPDLVVGAPAGVDLSSLGGILSGQVLGGSAYVYYGTGSGVSSSIGARLQGSSSGLLGNAANLFGYKVKGIRDAAGVRNGNIVIGAPTGGLIPNALSLSIQTGNVQLFKKQAVSPSGIVTANQVIESPKSSSILQILNTMHLNVLFGTSVDNAYDINCDSYPDLVIGEPLSSGTNLSQLQVNATGGSAYIYYGLADGTYNSNPIYDVSSSYGGEFLSVNATALFGFSVAGIPKVQGPTSKPRIIVGSPSGALDFDNSVLNLGATLGVLYNFVAGDNGLGKAYTFNPQLCGASHTLPAKLTNFTGQGVERKVLLNWKTTLEENLSEYVVEKSSDGVNFSTLAYVFAKGGSSINTYDMIDYHPVIGMNFYRLRIVDNDKRFTYSPVIKIKFSDDANGEIAIMPNPVTADYKVKLSGLEKGTYTIEIKNNQGQLLMKKTVVITQDDFTINMIKSNTMSPGIYSLHVVDADKNQLRISRFVVK